MSTHDFQRRQVIRTATGLALAPALGLGSAYAQSEENKVVVGTWGGDYQKLLQRIVNP